MRLSENGKRALVATGLFLPFLVLLITLVEMPDAAVVGDGAVLELQARQTARGENLLGPYSRFHFNHPGPIYFSLMLPLYYLSGQAHGSFFFTSVLINLAAVALIFLTIRRFSWLLFLARPRCFPLAWSIWDPEHCSVRGIRRSPSSPSDRLFFV